MRGIEVPVDSAPPRLRHGGAETVAGRQDVIEAFSPFRFDRGNFPQALVQDAQFISHGMAPLGGDIRLVQFVNRCGDATRQLDSLRSAQQSGGGFAWDLALKPHLKSRNNPQRLGN